MDKWLTGRSRSHHAFYIILLDNFMGPIVEKKARKKKKALQLRLPAPPHTTTPLSLPYDLPQLGPFYADLPGERMGTASGLWYRTEEKGQKSGNRRGWGSSSVRSFWQGCRLFAVIGQVCVGTKIESPKSRLMVSHDQTVFKSEHIICMDLRISNSVWSYTEGW